MNTYEKYIRSNLHPVSEWLTNINFFDNLLVICICIDTNRIYCITGTKPTNVIDFKCRSYNWENLTCSFERPYNPVASTYTLLFKMDTKRDISEPVRHF